MDIKPALTSGLEGIRRGISGLDKNAAAIAQASMDTATFPPVEALVDSKLNRLQVEVSASVIRSVDEAIGSLLDEKA